MKSLVGLFVALLRDLGEQCGADGVGHDEKSLLSRVLHEGDSFLTITLPTFAVALERALAEGSAAPWASGAFALQRSGVPRFLAGFLRRVFDKSGKLLDQPDINCILAVRQLCRFAKSVNLPCSDARQARAVEGYVECDSEVAEFPVEDEERIGLVRTYKLVAAKIAATLQLDEAEEAYVCTHGPGVVRERLTANERWDAIPYWPERLTSVGLSARMALFGHESPLFGVEFAEDSNWIPLPRAREDETPIKVTLVPKTLSTPRVIAVEPAAQQFAQQGISRWFRDLLERHPLTRGRVNFESQEVNRGLALDASRDGHLATLDLKDASDRVGLWHVETAFRETPGFLATLLAARSERAQLPVRIGRIPAEKRCMVLRKFASMGSALTFPIEAYIFFISIIASRVERRGLPVTGASIAAMAKDVYVYGDDLIVPAGEAPSIVEDLEALGFRVNGRKSFWTGRFRESCGMDAYAGREVTPVYLRRLPPSDRADVNGILSTVATANFLHQRGLYRTRDCLRQAVESLVGKLPGDVPDESPAVGWCFASGVVPAQRWNSDLQRLQARHLVAVPARMPDPLEGYGALAKCIRKPGSRGELKLEHLTEWKKALSEDEDHLTSSVRPYFLKLKSRWL